jgi:hypothetical protein
MATTQTYINSYKAVWTTQAANGSTPIWLTTMTNYWIGDATQPNGPQPAQYDFGIIGQLQTINLDFGGIA